MFSYLESGAFRFSARRAHAMSFLRAAASGYCFFVCTDGCLCFSGGVTRYNCYKLQLVKSVTGNLEKEINTIYIIYNIYSIKIFNISLRSEWKN